MATKAASAQDNSDRLVYILTYFFTWISGLIVYFTLGQKNKRMKFHSLQAILIGVVGFVIAFIPFIGLLGIILWLYGLYVGYMAYTGKDVSIPVLGDYAKKWSA